MPTYTVHEPHPSADNVDEQAMRLVFIKEGFAWLAFLVPALWLLFNRLWWELIGYIVVIAAAVALVAYSGGKPDAIGWFIFLINLAFGFEARNLHRSALERRNYRLAGIVIARNIQDAERRFLTEWLPRARASEGEAALPPVSSQPGEGQGQMQPVLGGSPAAMSAMGIGLAPS